MPSRVEPTSALDRKTRDAVRRGVYGKPRGGRSNDGRGADREIEMAGGVVGASELFTFTCFPKSQLKSIHKAHAIVVRRAHHEGLHEEDKWRTKTQTMPPPEHVEGAETAAMLFWALLASGQITIPRSTAGEASPNGPLIRSLTSPHDRIASCRPKTRHSIPT